MEREAWLNGQLAEFSPIVMPAAHALVQAIADLQKATKNLSREELVTRPNDAPSVAFHLRHIAGSIDRLLTYARGEELTDAQFDFLKSETNDEAVLTAAELTEKAIEEIRNALETLKNVQREKLFEPRYVGREKLPTTVFGLLFHIAEHTARHVGQIVTTAKIVKK
jgi:uncharacterized damage-inducible protein DinB